VLRMAQRLEWIRHTPELAASFKSKTGFK